MFRKVHVPLLGLVENMSCFTCPKCGHSEPIFGEGGGATTAADLGMELLGQVGVLVNWQSYVCSYSSQRKRRPVRIGCQWDTLQCSQCVELAAGCWSVADAYCLLEIDASGNEWPCTYTL
jgi:hypothetical protein